MSEIVHLLEEAAEEIRGLEAHKATSRRREHQFQAIAQSQQDRHEEELQQLRVQIDGWKLYMQLRRDVAEIETLVKKIVEDNPQLGELELSVEIDGISEVIQRIVGREI